MVAATLVRGQMTGLGHRRGSLMTTGFAAFPKAARGVFPAADGLKVLHICETARGGVGTYVDMLVALGGGQVVSRIVLPASDREMLSVGASVRTFVRRGRSVGTLRRLLAATLRERAAFRPDIVFCHSSFALLPLLLLRLTAPRSLLLYCPHGWAGAREMAPGAKRGLIRRAEAFLSRRADRVVNVSQGDLSHAADHGYGGRQVLIENGVRPVARAVGSARLSGEPDDIHLLFVGRLDRQKGLDILLDAFRRVHISRPDLRLHVIGESVVQGVDSDPSATTVEGVDFLGWIGADRIDAFYTAADLVVLPSRWEGLPLVLLEALRNGTPVLVSDRSNLPDLIEEGCSGLSVALDASALADVLGRLDKAALAAMRPAALALFRRRYDASRLGAEILALYRDVVGGPA